jgi:predicted homoserine dehydrogenase-like protein
MILIDTSLKKRAESGNILKVGMIGSGEMAKGMINQIMNHTPGMTVACTYGRNAAKVKGVFDSLGLKQYLLTNDQSAAEIAIAKGLCVITDDIDMLCELASVEVIVESTGAIEFGAETLLRAFKNKKHVLSFNAELDSTLGPILNKKAKEYGVKYALGDGDQPGVTMNLYRYVKAMGFTPMVCGNIKGMQDRYTTPETQKGFAASWGMNPVMATNFADGTKISFEQSCIANGTGMKVAQRGMLGFESTEHVDKLTHLFDVEKLKELGGIVDYIIGAQPSPGVFVYATTDDAFSKKYLKYGKLGEGPLYSFYQPYHLLFFDISSSIIRLMDFDDGVLVPLNGPVVDVITVAKCDLHPGDFLDGIGGFKSYGLCENHDQAVIENLLPMGLSEGCEVNKFIPIDAVVHYSDVIVPEGRLIDELMLEQLEISKSVLI